MKGVHRNRLQMAVALAACMLALFLQSACNMVSAEPRQAEPKTCSLKIYFRTNDVENGNVIPVSGAEFCIYRVADMEIQHAVNRDSAVFHPVERYKDCQVNYGAMNAEESKAAAKRLLAQKGAPDGRKVTGDDGVAVFTDLQEGMYLVEESDRSGVAENYSQVEPFLVSVPRYEDGTWIREVKAAPKSTSIRIPGRKIKANLSPAKTNPVKTGDPSKTILFLLLLEVSGIGLFLLLRRKERLYGKK